MTEKDKEEREKYLNLRFWNRSDPGKDHSREASHKELWGLVCEYKDKQKQKEIDKLKEALEERSRDESDGPNDAVYARMGTNDWRVMSRGKAEQYKYTEIISAGIPYPGRLKQIMEVSDENCCND